MSTNLVQLADQLKHLSDQQLQMELQRPSGAVPPYLALAEAQRRAMMRSGAATQQGQQQQSTVLQDTLQALNARQMPPAGPGMPPPPAGVPPGMPPASFQGQAPPSGGTPGAVPMQNFQAPKPMQEGGLFDDTSNDYLEELGRRQQWALGDLLPGYARGGFHVTPETDQSAALAPYLRRQSGGSFEDPDGDEDGDGEDTDDAGTGRDAEGDGEEDSGADGMGGPDEDEQEEDAPELRADSGLAAAVPSGGGIVPHETAAVQPQRNLIGRLTQAIARFEGFYPGTVAHRNNNPGNLRWAPNQADSHNGFAVFADAAAGFRALERHVAELVNEGLTLNQFFAGKKGVYPGYAPAADHNSPYHYAATVASWLGVPPNVPLDQLTAKGMQEGGPVEDDEDEDQADPYAELFQQSDGDGDDGDGFDEQGADRREAEDDQRAPIETGQGGADREATDTGWRQATPEEIAESEQAQVAPEQTAPQGDWMGITSGGLGQAAPAQTAAIAPETAAPTTAPAAGTTLTPDDVEWWRQFQTQNQRNQARLEALYGKLQQRPPVGDLLLRMGAGMMAGTSPHALTNIGQGLLGGVTAMDQQKQQQLANTIRVLQEEGTLSGQQATLAVHEADRRAALAREQATQAAQDARARLNGQRNAYGRLLPLPGVEGAADAPPDGKPVQLSDYVFHPDPDNPGQGKWISKTQRIPFKFAPADTKFLVAAGIDPSSPTPPTAAQAAKVIADEADFAAKSKQPSATNQPLGAALVAQLNGAFQQRVDRYHSLYPDAPPLTGYQLSANATQREYQDMEQNLVRAESVAAAAAGRAATETKQQKAADQAELKAGQKAFAPTLDSAERFNVMATNYQKALKNHDQQAMLSLLYNHIGMTTGMQKGARMTKDIIHEAMVSRPWLQGMVAKFDKDGYLQGVTLTPQQMRSMVDLAKERFAEDVVKARNEAAYAGVTNDGPARTPNKAVVNHYLGLANGDYKKAIDLARADGWTIQ